MGVTEDKDFMIIWEMGSGEGKAEKDIEFGISFQNKLHIMHRFQPHIKILCWIIAVETLDHLGKNQGLANYLEILML